MFNKFINFIKSILLLTCLGSSALFAKEITVWHSLDGPLGEKFESLVQRFNHKPEIANAEIKVVPIYKGTYEQTLVLGLNAIKGKRTSQTPHILQVYEMGNLVMQKNPKAYVPLNKLTKNPSPQLARNHFLAPIAAFYRSRNGDTNLPSLPFTASSVVLFYNKNAFKAAGLDPEKPPKTWEEFEVMAEKLKGLGIQNVLASGWLTGHHIDQTASWHNQSIATEGNGVDSDAAKLNLNHPFFIHHVSKLAAWHKKQLFSLDTRTQAEKAFASGKVVMLTQGANRLAFLEKHNQGLFDIGVGYFPYWENTTVARTVAGDASGAGGVSGVAGKDAPQNTVAGGSSFWAISGHPEEDYEAIQAFFEYITSIPVQTEWHQETAYMPVVQGVKEASEEEQFYSSSLKGEAARIALDSFISRLPKENSRGILLANYPKVRELMDKELAAAIQGKKTPEEALNQIVLQGNKIIGR